LVEHATENRSVGGSIPPLGTIAHHQLRNLVCPVLKSKPCALNAHVHRRIEYRTMCSQFAWPVAALAAAQGPVLLKVKAPISDRAAAALERAVPA
jgi:hypothetical protein